MREALLARIVALGLAGASLLSGAGAWRHFRMAWGDQVFGFLQWPAAIMLVPASLFFAASALALLLRPRQWAAYPFLKLGRFWRWWLAGILVVFFVLGLLFTGHDTARYPCRSACALWTAIVILPVGLPPRWLDRWSALWRWRAIRWTDLFAGNLVVLVITLELALRALALWVGQDALLLNRSAGYRLAPGRYAHGLRVNSLGFADDEFVQPKRPGVFRIAALGDSFSAGVNVAYSDNYLTLLESRIHDVEVLNFGVCGTGPREYHQLLTTLVWNYHPDMVLVPIFVGNDITEWIASPELRRFNPDALHVELLARRVGRLALERWRVAAEDSKGFRMGRRPPFSSRTYLELTAGRLVVCRKHQTGPDREKWRNVFNYLDAILRDCEARKVPVALLLLPDEFQVNADLLRRALELRSWSQDDIELLLPQKRLADFCQERGVPCLDLFDTIAAAGPDAYITNDGHWTPLGNRVAADTVAEWLRNSVGPHAPRDKRW
jgi:lysophospholipase L1-like esterase